MSTTIASLANETLCEIFEHLFHSLTVEEWYTHTLPSTRLVSRHWNGLLEMLPTIWTSLLITEKSAYRAGQSPFQSTQLRLLRSFDLPLDVYIRLKTSTRPKSFGVMESNMIGGILREVAPRLASIDLRGISGSRTNQMTIFSRLNDVPMPLLRSFAHNGGTMCYRMFDRDIYFFDPASVLQHEGRATREMVNKWGSNLYPALTDVRLEGAMYNFDHLPVMRSIRRLCIKLLPRTMKPFMNQFIDILRPVTGTLEVLELEDVIKVKDSDPERINEPIIFEKLQVLSFGYTSPNVVLSFLESVRLPALVDLALEDTSCELLRDPHNEVRFRLPFLLIRYFPLAQIERLSLRNVTFPPDDEYYQIGLGRPRDEQWRLYHQEPEVPVNPTSIRGHDHLPVFMFLLSKFRSLKHLHLTENLDLKQILCDYWHLGTFATLETLYLDGTPEWLIELMWSVEKWHRKALQVIIGEEMASALSDEEKEELLHTHIDMFASDIGSGL